jgi:ATP-dependent RNA helicase DHX37/DHR1
MVQDGVFVSKTPEFFALIMSSSGSIVNVVVNAFSFLAGVAAVEPDWFAQLVPQHCSFSKPLKDPTPRFDETEGIVKCHMNVSFGARVWCLPAQELEYPKSTDRYKWFARFLLEGQVVPMLSPFRQNLLVLPSTMVKTWSKLQPRTEALLKELADRDVDDKASLLAMWKKDNNYLLKAYLQWVPESTHVEVKKIWPPV